MTDTTGITIELPQEAVDHAEAHAKALGYESAAAWAKEWLVNTIKGLETNKKQLEVNKMQAKIHRDVEKLYGVGD